MAPGQTGNYNGNTAPSGYGQYQTNQGAMSGNGCAPCQSAPMYGSMPCDSGYGSYSNSQGNYGAPCGNGPGNGNRYFNNQSNNNQSNYGNYGSGCGDAGWNGAAYGQSGTSAGGYGVGGYSANAGGNCGPGRSYLSGRRNQSANWVGGVSALIFQRDYEDDVGMGYNAGGQYLFSTDADMDTMGGVEASLGRRGCNGYGWEGRYWGLYPGSSFVNFGGTPYTALGGLSEVFHTPTGATVLDIYNRADTHQLVRNNNVTNVEFNMLRNAGSNSRTSYEVLAGARWLQFDEQLVYSAFSTYPGDPAIFTYNSQVDNTLLGFQLGGRSERCLSSRLRLATGFSCGIFSNRIRQNQRMYDEGSGTDAEIYSGPFTGRPYNYTSWKNDIAMMGELNIGTYYLITNSMRLSIGYRAIGVSGVALAADQIPYNFTNGSDIQRIDSNGSLILHGAYIGLQSCF
jgi:hypothetical protein